MQAHHGAQKAALALRCFFLMVKASFQRSSPAKRNSEGSSGGTRYQGTRASIGHAGEVLAAARILESATRSLM